jgi:hypothetical protein
MALIESVAQWYDSSTTYIHALASDQYGNPGALDTTVTYPTLQNGQEIVFWVQVASSGTEDATDTYQFILRGSATTDETDLSGTVVDLVTSPTFTQSGSWCQKTDHTGGFFMAVIPPIAQSYRYWQPYFDVTSVSADLDLTIYTGLGLKSAMPVRVGNAVKNTSGVGMP